MKITGRSSTITNSFINSIIPVIVPTNNQVKEALDILGMDHDKFQCAYCGDRASEWDHLRPLVQNKKPTGYISEIHNLVPACGKCNQSKGNKPWHMWIMSSAKLSPKSRGVTDLHERIQNLQKYEAWLEPTKIDFESVVGKEIWDEHWANWELVQSTMRRAQVLAADINKAIAIEYKKL
ncbi:HNH endonuclease [Pseudidiomarina salinarum]|nr:HNH endonuclease [Pseudidiomarina salinarum]